MVYFYFKISNAKMSKNAINEGYTGFSMKSTPLPKDDLEYIFKNDSEEEISDSETETEISKKSESKKPDIFKKTEKKVSKTSKDETNHKKE